MHPTFTKPLEGLHPKFEELMRIWEAAENDAEARRLPLQRKRGLPKGAAIYVGE
jgi:hypothetical protein